MAVTNELNITLIDGQQSGGAVLSDQAIQTLSGASNGEVDIDCAAGGTIIVTAGQINNDFVLYLTGSPGADFNLEVPDGKRVFMVQNTTAKVATVDTLTGSADLVVVEAGARKVIRSRGFDLEVVSLNGVYLPAFFSGVPGNTELVLLYTVPFEIILPVGLVGSSAHALTAPADGAKAFDVQKNESSVGSVDFAQSSKVATFTFATATTFVAGDRLELFAPGTADSVMADIGITLQALRV